MNEKLIDINTTFKELGGEISSGIMFFHCLSGCDPTTAFFMKSKNVLFKAWKCYPQRTALSKVFKALSFYPSADTIKSSLPTINEFISHVYTDEIMQLNIARFNLFLRCRSLRACTILTHQAQCFPGRLDFGKHVSPRTCTVCIRLWLEERYLFSACNGLGSRS